MYLRGGPGKGESGNGAGASEVNGYGGLSRLVQQGVGFIDVFKPYQILLSS